MPATRSLWPLMRGVRGHDAYLASDIDSISNNRSPLFILFEWKKIICFRRSTAVAWIIRSTAIPGVLRTLSRRRRVDVADCTTLRRNRCRGCWNRNMCTRKAHTNQIDLIVPSNKRMQSDQSARYARTLAADAGRYVA